MIRLIKDLSELSGTCYFEFFPGIYSGGCWNKDSVFIKDLEIFYIEPILAKHIVVYDHYNFMSVDKYTWQQIIIDLNLLKESLRKSANFDEYTSNLDFSFHDAFDYFAKNFDKAKIELMKMIDDLVRWLINTLEKHNKISVLGM